MNTLKTMFLGSAGAVILLAASTAAQAGGPSREPVWRCDTKGFIEYPGSDVCFKMGGKIETWIEGHDKNIDDDSKKDVEFNVFDIRDDDSDTFRSDTFNMSALARLTFDIRQATSKGVIRAYIEMQADDKNSNSSDSLGLRHAYIQYGSWLFGKTTSATLSGLTPGHFVEPHSLPGDGPTTRLVTLRYTIKLGNGLTARLAIEDQARRDRTGGGNFVHGDLSASRSEMPDFVATLKVDRPWGAAHFATAGGVNSVICGGGSCIGSHREGFWFAQAAVEIEVGGSDLLMLQGQYGDGAIKYVDTGARNGLSVNTVTGSIENTESWAVHGGWEHAFSKSLKATLGAAYVENDYNIPLVSGGDGGLSSTTVLDATVVWVELVKKLSKRMKVGISVIYGENSLLDPTKEGDAVSVGVEAERKW